MTETTADENSKAQEQTESMKSLNRFLNELSRYMVHQMTITLDGRIDVSVNIENRIISGASFHTQSDIKITKDP